MVRFALAATFALATSAVALPQIGGGNNNNNAGAGTQFITGECAADADCASGCCAANTGLCAARAVAEEGAGCGFGGGNAADGNADDVDNVVVDDGNNEDEEDNTGGNNNAGTGDQFITGECTADADCASGCCAANTGLCAARAVAEEGAGCGFGGAAAADDADDADDDAEVDMVVDDANDAADDNDDDNNAGTGEQFITGECESDADCASGCCAADTGLCAARAVAEEGAGCGFGGGLAGGNDATETADAETVTATEEAVAVETEDVADVDDDADAEDDDGEVAGAENVGSGDGSQFITGACIEDADCASGCCAELDGSGVCSAELAQFENGKNGCGFVDPTAA